MIMGISKINTILKSNTPHTHKNDELIYYTSGEGTLHINGEIYNVSGGSIAAIPSGASHYTNAETELKSIFLILNNDINLSLTRPILLRDDYEQTVSALLKIIYSKYLENNGDNTLLIEHLIRAYISYILSSDFDGCGSYNKEVEKVKISILHHCREKNFNLKETIADTGYSYNRLRDIFKEKYSLTPLQYLTKIRIDYAESLILSAPGDYKIYILSEMCGFSDPFYFSKKYKKLKGISPYQHITQEVKK